MAKPVAVPLAISLLLHVAIIVLLVLNLSFSSPLKVAPPPKIIEAKLVSMKQVFATKAEPKPTEQPQAPPPELDKPAPIKPEPPKPDVAKLRQIEKQKALDKQRELDKAKAAKLAAEKKAAEQKREAERKQEERAKQLRQQEKAELAKAMAAEDKRMAAARDQAAVASYVNLITRDIQNNWSRPPSARRDMQVTLLIQLIPSGDVIDVNIVDSSGNTAFDRSAVDAVRRVGKFAYLKALADKSPDVFDQNFRHLRLVFTPEDLRQ